MPQRSLQVREDRDPERLRRDQHRLGVGTPGLRTTHLRHLGAQGETAPRVVRHLARLAAGAALVPREENRAPRPLDRRLGCEEVKRDAEAVSEEGGLELYDVDVPRRDTRVRPSQALQSPAVALVCRGQFGDADLANAVPLPVLVIHVHSEADLFGPVIVVDARDHGPPFRREAVGEKVDGHARRVGAAVSFRHDTRGTEAGDEGQGEVAAVHGTSWEDTIRMLSGTSATQVGISSFSSRSKRYTPSYPARRSAVRTAGT